MMMEEPKTQASTSIVNPERIPLSFPSILINPKLKHLSNQLPKNHRHTKTDPSSTDSRPIGKRRLQRVANSQFSFNPHVSRPTTRDYQLWTADSQVKFPTPPPRGFPSSLYIPPAEPIPIDPFSATMGAFNRSLKGVRKNIRRLVGTHPSLEGGPGPVEEMLIKIDERLSSWIDSNTVWKATETDYTRTIVEPNPWPSSGPARHQPLPKLCSEPSIVEVSRSPHMLNWEVQNPFGRFLVHCVARYYGIVSFSRPAPSPISDSDQADPQKTVVCMVKAHFPTRRGSRIDGNQSLDTPPTTDLDSELSAVEVLSEDSGALTDDEPPLPNTVVRASLGSSPPRIHPVQTSTPTRVTITKSKDQPKSSELVDSDAADHSSLDSFGDDEDRLSTSTREENNQVDWTSHVDQDPNQTITAIVPSTPSQDPNLPVNSNALKTPLSTAFSPTKSPAKISFDYPQLSFLEWVRS
ncbi:hypothetical protein MJO28_000738 [Puccinia striiformis f. sp. tritici]|uniref:R3H-associated N-terminal domain-containing protein n=3 Tax=Puccinia striiformis TaxID=27350 RepID=A0A0L0V2B7_9BASI|nr:hypothetical protein Pst134EA_000499 [Puccinia striiformis f. sp. tritici]KAI9601276.1 hypothetical protein H4Q26_001090 [Puccinia striiformis f. sp. tritici PST-130]KNE93432.1 hypothetical protein PSTG_13254 [Puccinia striiformis f. sp. tritici PST-78]POW07603.1 hypothetical protein PSTT_08160 [Puccinia striiformis]KAH9466646.1 hypothetical protein Pst134EB_001694 [Puccinia striiformis f. sp. tritici]KAH9473428.1 hypothetical protein Pst134EA_000499 [Puccinia striiformis f. sp. tritici]